MDNAPLNFESFRRLAMDETLSPHGKTGFEEAYRAGFEPRIFRDICNKLSLQEHAKTVLDVGPGCSDLSHLLIEHCETHKQRLLLADSPEMLAHLPGKSFIRKIPGMFPETAMLVREAAPEGVDKILCYSVLQYFYIDTNIWETLDSLLALLKIGGILLLGDIPNASRRQRFFSSSEGVVYHQKRFPGTMPDIAALTPKPGQINDDVMLTILHYVRSRGAQAQIVPQSEELPMANRREDILIRKNDNAAA